MRKHIAYLFIWAFIVALPFLPFSFGTSVYDLDPKATYSPRQAVNEGSFYLVGSDASKTATAVTASAAELNILDGATVTAAKLNYLTDIAATSATQWNAGIQHVSGTAQQKIEYGSTTTPAAGSAGGYEGSTSVTTGLSSITASGASFGAIPTIAGANPVTTASAGTLYLSVMIPNPALGLPGVTNEHTTPVYTTATQTLNYWAIGY